MQLARPPLALLLRRLQRVAQDWLVLRVLTDDSASATGLTTALHNVGYTMTEREPDYVVLGETRTYSFTAITRAIRLIEGGARFIATNPDVTGPSTEGPLPATGSIAALITAATGVKPYYVGKPNPLMMRSALNRIDAHSESTVMIGDRLDTDVRSGLEAGLRSILVLTGSTKPDQVDRYPFVPTRVCDSLESIIDGVKALARPGTQVVVMSNGGFGGLHGKLAAALEG